jgi:hypothetical protein
MAYIRNKLRISTPTGVSTDLSAANEMPDYEVGDYIMIYITKRRAGEIDGAEGYTNIFTRLQSSEMLHSAWYKKTTGTGEPLPVVNGGQSFTNFEIEVLIIADADPTTFVDASSITGSNPASSASTPSVTTTTANCLILHSACCYISTSGENFSVVPENNDMLLVDGKTGTNTGDQMFTIGASYQETAGATPQKDFSSSNSNRFNVGTIAINNASGGITQPYKKTGFNRVFNWTFDGKLSLSYENFGDIVGATYLGTAASTGAVGPIDISLASSLDTMASESENITGWHGLVIDIGSDLDMTNHLLNMTFIIGGAAFSLNAASNITLVLADNLNNWRTFNIYPQSLLNDGSEFPFFVDPIDGDFAAESVTPPDFTNLRKIGMARRSASLNSGNNISFGGAYLIEKNQASIIGGSTSKPVNNMSIADNLGGIDTNPNSINAQGTGQVLYPQSLQIGDGTTKTVTSFSGVSFETPQNYSEIDGRFLYNVGATGDFAGISIYASSSDEIDLKDCIIGSSVVGFFEINASSVAPTLFETNGMQVRNCDVTWHSLFPVSSARFVNCCDVDFKAAAVTNVAVVDTCPGNSTLIEDGSVLNTVSFETVTSSNYAITIGLAGDFDFTDVSYTGFTTDINVTATTGIVNITINSGATPTFITAGATVNLIVPVVSSTGDVTGMPTAGGNIRLQIVNVTASTSSAWAATTAYAIGDRVLRTTGVGTERERGLFFVCSTAGTTGGSEPSWDTTAGNTTTDGTCVWTTYDVRPYSADPASDTYTETFTDGEQYKLGDVVNIRFAELDGATSFKIFEQNVAVISSGWSAICDEVTDVVYAQNATDGSLITKFTADFINDEIDLAVAANFTAAEAYAFYCYVLTIESGISQFWGGLFAIDAGNYRINTATLNLYFDNVTTATQRQTDSARIYRDNGTYPVKDPTTSGFGIDINWKNVVFIIETGVSGLTAPESAQLFGTALASKLTITNENVKKASLLIPATADA